MGKNCPFSGMRFLPSTIKIISYLKDNYDDKLMKVEFKQNRNKLRGLSLRANYTDRATAAFQRS
jgi:hypothetical protein